MSGLRAKRAGQPLRLPFAFCSPRYRDLLFALALAVGLVVRLVTLPWPGTGDTTVWKVWMFNAARGPVGTLYGVGGTPPERRILTFAATEATVDYPPLTLYELGAAGRLYRAWSHHRFPNTDALNAFAKFPPLAADIGFAALLAICVRRRWAVLAYWLNPAVILNASVLGYLDATYVLPAAGAIVASVAGSPFVAGALIAAAVLTKAQALFVLPAVVVPLLHVRRGATNTGLMFAGVATVVVALTLPVVAAGGLPNMIQALSRLATHDMVSANACNLWWIIAYLVRATASMHDLGAWTAFTMPTRILGISRMVEIGYPNPRVVGIGLTATSFAWALWTARRTRTLGLAAGLAAFLLHAYAVLSAQVHENHLFAAVPLLLLASADEPAFRPIAAGVTAIVALNLNLFYGLGNGMGYAIPRGITIVDATVVVAVMNCALFLWHAQVLRRVCSRADAFRPTPAPAFHQAPAARTDSSTTQT